MSFKFLPLSQTFWPCQGRDLLPDLQAAAGEPQSQQLPAWLDPDGAVSGHLPAQSAFLCSEWHRSWPPAGSFFVNFLLALPRPGCSLVFYILRFALQYLLNFLRSAPAGYASYCAKRLRRTALNGVRGEPPTWLELQVLRRPDREAAKGLWC